MKHGGNFVDIEKMDNNFNIDLESQYEIINNIFTLNSKK